MGTIFVWEQVQAQAKRLKLEIKREGPHFQVYPTEEFMGRRTDSPGGRLTTGLATLEGLAAFLAGIEAIISREEMIQSLVRVPGPIMLEKLAKGICKEPNNVLQMGHDGMQKALQTIFDILYWDSDAQAYDPDKEWDSAADFMEMVADQFTRHGLMPERQSTDLED